MLHCEVYNSGLTKELKKAFMDRNVEYLIAEIRLAAIDLVSIDDTSSKEYNEISDHLHIALALHDSLAHGGSTVSFMTDFINL